MSELFYTQISNSNIKSSRRAWHESLIDYFELLKTMEDKIDLIRSSLCSEKNFSPKKLFEYIDKRNKKNITLNDLNLVLEENKIIFKEENLRRFIHNFDKDNDFCLDYNEFIGIILPRKNKLLQKNFITLFQYNNNYEINNNIKKIFCDLLIEEMKLIEGCNKIIKEIQEYSGFTPYEAFLDIVNGDGIYINENNLAQFLMENNIEINEEDSHQLIFRLDKDNDGKISYEEFQNMFLILHKSNKKEKSNNKQNFFNDINKDNLNDDININKNKININYNENNYKKINNFKHNNNYNNSFSIHGLNPIRNDANASNNKILKKDFKIEFNNNSNIEQLSEPNIFYDSLECSKNQENSINSSGKDRNNQINNLISNDNKIKYEKNQNNFRNKIEKQIILDEKLKKIFQIPKDDKLYTPIIKKEKEEEKVKVSESPKFSYTKLPLYYDYSTNSNSNIIKKRNLFRKCNSSKNISTPYSSNINNEETDYITHDNNNQTSNNINNNSKTEEASNKKNIKNKKINKIPHSSSRKTDIKNNNIVLYNTSNNNKKNINKESHKSNNSYNKIKDKNHSSNKKIVNNLFQNIFNEYQNNNNALENNIINDKNKNKQTNNNVIKLKKLKNNLKKVQNLQDLILNSPFLEKNEQNKENINIIHNNKNRTPVQILNKNINIKEEILKNYNSTFSKNKNKNKEEFKDIDIKKNIEEKKNLDNFDINNYSQNSVISTSLINNPTQTSFDNNIDTNSYFLNNDYNNSNRNIDIDNNIIHQRENDNNEIKDIVLNKNSENYFTLEGSNNNNNININLDSNANTRYNNTNLNISGKEEKVNNYENDINYMKNNNLNNSINTSSSDDNNNENFDKFIKERYNLIKNQKDEYMYNHSSKINFELTQYERFNNLYNLLYDFLKWELILENIKISLSVREDINIKLLFELFDTKKRNLISISDISKTLKNLGMKNVNSNDTKYIFLQNNKKLKEKLNFNEFCEIVLPNNSEKRKGMNERIINDNYKNDLTDKTKNIICLLFQKIIEGERSNEFYRNNLAMVPDSSGFDLFNLMKKNYSIGIYKEDIDNFLNSRGKVFYKNETEVIRKKLDRN